MEGPLWARPHAKSFHTQCLLHSLWWWAWWKSLSPFHRWENGGSEAPRVSYTWKGLALKPRPAWHRGLIIPWASVSSPVKSGSTPRLHPQCTSREGCILKDAQKAQVSLALGPLQTGRGEAERKAREGRNAPTFILPRAAGHVICQEATCQVVSEGEGLSFLPQAFPVGSAF